MRCTIPLSFMIETLPAIETAVAQAEDTRAEFGRAAGASPPRLFYQKRSPRGAEQLPPSSFWRLWCQRHSNPPIVILPNRRCSSSSECANLQWRSDTRRIRLPAAVPPEAATATASFAARSEEDVRLAFAGAAHYGWKQSRADLTVTLLNAS